MSARNDNRLIIGGPPHADLMPPEINLEKILRAQRRGLVTIVVLSLFLVIVVYLLTAGVSQASQDRLAAEKAKTAGIVAGEAKYSAARSLSAEVDAAKTARLDATYLEIDWESYLAAIGVTKPAGSHIVSISAKIPDVPPAGPIVADKNAVVADVRMVVNVASPKDIPDWFDIVDSMPGFIDVSPPAFQFNETTGGWDTTIVVHVNAQALEGRFSEQASK